MFKLLDLNGTGSLGRYEFDWFKTFFRWSPFIKSELKYIDNYYVNTDNADDDISITIEKFEEF